METRTEFFILTGSLADLSKIDFSCYNVQCLRINSKKLRDICTEMSFEGQSEHNLGLLNEVSEEFENVEKPFVLLPLDFTKDYDETSLLECYKIILLLFPGDLTIYSKIYFQLFNKKNLHWASYTEYEFSSSGIENYYDNFVYFPRKWITKINEFIKLYHDRKNKIDYIETTLNSYISSFREKRIDMAFLLLCISLESIIEGANELNFRIKRNVSILCAENKLHAEIIYHNLDLIYSLRSKIVHGEKYNFSKVSEYLPYLQNLVSRLIIELILQNIETLSELNKSLIFTGFDNKRNLKKNSSYMPMTLNITSYVDTFVKKLKK